MASYDLTGTGVQSLSAAVTHLFVDVTTFGAGFSSGLAIPENFFHLGLLRLGFQGATRPVIPIDATHMIIDCPALIDSLGYSLRTGTLIHVTESFTVP